MRHLLSAVFAGFLAASATPAASTGPLKCYVLELKGGSRVFSTDAPVRKGRVLLFHSYPGGTSMSLPAEDVAKIVLADAEEPPATTDAGLAPGQAKFVGNAVEGPGYQAPPVPRAAPGTAPPEYYADYGYTGGYWGGGGAPYPPPRPPVPHPVAGPRIGSNGYPILAPPGSPGSVPPPIGANGYPILAPPPPVAAPRRP